ncbi:hypothetical protein LINGRAHAP2_LOCUS33889 [Linum grandiflorum]
MSSPTSILTFDLHQFVQLQDDCTVYLTMANVGGKLMVVWEDIAAGGGDKDKETEMEIWCAEIELQKEILLGPVMAECCVV